VPFGATVRLLLLAHGRSGDKGNLVNIGVIARRAAWYPWIVEALPAERVHGFLRPLGIGSVERFELANLGALNFLVRRALGGGGAMALKLDAQGKTMAQALLRLPLELSAERAAEVFDHWGDRLPPHSVLSGGPS
jgi:hypothetical protein